MVPPVAEKDDTSNLAQDSTSLSQTLPATTTTETSRENGGSDGENIFLLNVAIQVVFDCFCYNSLRPSSDFFRSCLRIIKVVKQ